MSALDEAIALAEQRQLKTSLRVVQSVIDEEPDCLEALLLLGRIWLLLRQFDSALAPLQRAAKLQPKDYQARESLGRCLGLLGQHEKAITSLQAAQRKRPKDFRAAYRLARTCFAACRFKLAEQFYVLAAKLEPSSGQALVGAGLAAFYLSKWDRAVERLRQAESRMPDEAVIAGYLGCAMIYQGRFDEAKATIQDALARKPDMPEVKLRYGELLIRMRNFPEACAWFDTLVEEDPSNAWAVFFQRLARYDRTGASEDLDRLPEAAVALEARDAPRYNPWGIGTVWSRIASFYIKREELEAALLPLRRAIELVPSKLKTRILLGQVLQRLGRYEEAIEQAVIARQADEADEGAVMLQGSCLMALERYHEAAALFEELAESAPFSAAAFLGLGKAKFMEGRLQEAETAVATAFRINSGMPGLRPTIVDLERHLGRPIDADAGLSFGAAIEMPIEFAPRATLQELTHRPSIFQGLTVAAQVVGAVIHREILARFGQNYLGYIWAILIPLALFVTLDVIFHVIDRGVPYGATIETFLLTGIIPVLVFFMNAKTRALAAVRSNKNLLYFRQVKPLTLITSAFILDFLTGITILAVAFFCLYLYGHNISVHDPLQVLTGLVLISLLAMVFGGVFGLAALAIPDVVNVSQAFNRVVFFTSGVFFYANELPPGVRKILLYNPIFHLVELIRDGFFLPYEPTGVTWSYPVACIVLGLLVMLSLERLVRRYQMVT